MTCPCGRAASYEDCCGVYHGGREPTDAESLMRSRFSAFVRKDANYLYRTLHPQHDEHPQGPFAFARKMKQHFGERIVYQRLEVLDASEVDARGVAKVLFRVRVMRRGKDVSFAELSYFARDGVALRYLSGVTVAYDALAEPASIERFEAERR